MLTLDHVLYTHRPQSFLISLTIIHCALLYALNQNTSSYYDAAGQAKCQTIPLVFRCADFSPSVSLVLTTYNVAQTPLRLPLVPKLTSFLQRHLAPIR